MFEFDTRPSGPAPAPPAEIRALPFVLERCTATPLGPHWVRVAAVENLERAEILAMRAHGPYVLKNAAGTPVAFLASDGRRVQSSRTEDDDAE